MSFTQAIETPLGVPIQELSVLNGLECRGDRLFALLVVSN